MPSHACLQFPVNAPARNVVSPSKTVITLPTSDTTVLTVAKKVLCTALNATLTTGTKYEIFFSIPLNNAPAIVFTLLIMLLILILMLFTVSLNLFKSTPLLESAFFITFVNAVKTSPIFLNFLKLWINGLI